MAALGRTGSRRLRLCGQKRLVSTARTTAERLPLEDVGGEGQSLSPQGRQVRFLVGFGLASSALSTCSSKFHLIGTPLHQTSLYSTEASPYDEEVMDDFLNDPTISRETSIAHILKLCEDGNLSAVSKLLVSLHSKGIFLGSSAYNLLLAAASRKNDTNLSGQVFKHLVATHEHLSSASYFDLAKAFLKTSDCMELLRFVKEVSEMTFPRTTIIVNRIILSFAESRQFDKALFIFNNMKILECKPDLVTCNTILDMLGRAGCVDEMLDKFAAMKEEGMVPDIISYNTILNSLRKVGRFDMCEALQEEMERSGIKPDLLTYTALIETFGRSGNIERSLRLFSEMKLRQIRPSVYIYKSLVSNLKKTGKVELAMTLLEEMESSISELAGPGDFKPRKHR